jgi:hypothetical protein
MKTHLALLLLLSAVQVRAALPEPVAVRSRSGQFAIHGLPLSKQRFSFIPPTGISYARLDPGVLAISSENIKQALLAALDLTDRWQGRIAVSLQPVVRDNEEIVIASVRFTDGWQYQVQIPEHVDKARLTKAIVEVLLLEIAQRGAGDRRLELPPWLASGLAEYITANASSPLIVEAGSLTDRTQPKGDALKKTRETLRSAGSMSFNQLSWPDTQTDRAAYDACAHLFVRELLQKGGGVLLSDLLWRLRDHLNWQTAFLRAGGFGSLRDVDKWWTLNLVQFAGRESFATWSSAELRLQLDEALATPVQVRHDVNRLPMTTQISLQQILQEWDFKRQAPHVRQMLHRLEVLRLRSSGVPNEIINGYHRALSEYLVRRERRLVNARTAVTEAVGLLNELDAKRETMAVAPPGAPVLSGTQEASR